METEQIKQELAALAEPQYREFSLKLIPGADHILGVRMPALRKLAATIAKEDARGFLARNPLDCHELKLLHGLVLGRARLPQEECLAALTAFLPHIGNWAVCDSSIAACTWLARDREAAWARFSPLLSSQNEYEVRVFLVILLFHFTEREWLSRLLRAAGQAKHQGYYARMAAAWLLSDCFLLDPYQALAALGDPGLDETTRRMAIQKVLDSRRVSEDYKDAARALRPSGKGRRG